MTIPKPTVPLEQHQIPQDAPDYVRWCLDRAELMRQRSERADALGEEFKAIVDADEARSFEIVGQWLLKMHTKRMKKSKKRSKGKCWRRMDGAIVTR